MNFPFFRARMVIMTTRKEVSEPSCYYNNRYYQLLWPNSPSDHEWDLKLSERVLFSTVFVKSSIVQDVIEIKRWPIENDSVDCNCFELNFIVNILLLRCGDVESNPGPFDDKLVNQKANFKSSVRPGLSTDSSDDESNPSIPSREEAIKSENTTDDSEKAASSHDASQEVRNRLRKSPVKLSTRTKSLQSPTKVNRSPTKTLKSAGASHEIRKETFIITSRKDTNGGRAYESNTRSGALDSASSSHTNIRHNNTVERTPSTGQWWRMKEDRQKQLELRLEKLSEQVSTIIENSKNVEESLKTRLEQVEHEVLDLPEDYDDIEDEENQQASDEGFDNKMENNTKLKRVRRGLVEENIRLRKQMEHKQAIYEQRLDESEVEINSLRCQLTELMAVYDDLQDRLYEIDRSWQNNLLFFGIKPDQTMNGNQVIFESQECIEQKIKACIRNNLNIGRYIPITRAQRIYNGTDVRGFKPVVVNFQNWSDKEEIFRKSKILKNCGIIVEEDFSRAAKFRRKELEKLVKEIKQLSPDKKCIFKYDKLIVDDQVYIYNESEKRIEKLPYSVYSTAATGTIGSSNISHSVSHTNLYTNSSQDSREDAHVDSDQPSLLSRRYQKQQPGGATSSIAVNHSHRYPSTASMNAAAMSMNTATKRSQSVESLLSRIPHFAPTSTSVSPKPGGAWITPGHSPYTPHQQLNSHSAGADNGANNNEHLSSSDNTSTVSMSMSNPNGNASTDGVLTVTLQNDHKQKAISTSTNHTTELKSSLKKRSHGSVSSTASYPNSSSSNKDNVSQEQKERGKSTDLDSNGTSENSSEKKP